MKRLTLLFTMIITLPFLLIGCGGQKEVSEATGYENVETPCPSEEYQSNKKYIRATMSGNSPNESTSRKIAIQNAKGRLAGNLQTKIRQVRESYTDQKDIKNKSQFKRNWQEMSRSAVDQTLTQVEVVCEQLQKKEGERMYKTYVAIQMPTEALLNTMKEEISKREKLRLEYDKQQFEDTFEKEMKELDKDRP